MTTPSPSRPGDGRMEQPARGSFFDVVVTERRDEAAGTISVSLASAGDGRLPTWTPGSHVEVLLPSGRVRQYSLCGDTPGVYRIAVLREQPGRGGSQELHAVAKRGAALRIRGPRNNFPLVPAAEHLLIAGGIGITPILSMARALAAADMPWRLWYGGRSRTAMAFLDELEQLGGQVHVVAEDEQGLLDLPTILATASPQTAIYTCGPPAMLSATEACCAKLSLGMNLHVERFAPADAARPEPVADPQKKAVFEVELGSSGQVIEVSPGQTILDAVRSVFPGVYSSCEDGYCGTCETRVLEGVPEHYDTFLSDEERERNDTMMICVGRAKSARLVLDL